ncbi:hypothetical protein [Sulfurospirillum arcachonense]|uniref:hypothetical protein n=1 Tax=Sulfurospirillum arcachonense TaxID=57666 RepID=UPI00046AC049|nr:hypothetical protein [Sulfurospirillum arcachonense]
MYRAFISYMKGLFGLEPSQREYIYYNPEGDFQDIRNLMPVEDATLLPFLFGLVIFCVFLCWAIYKLVKYIQYKRSNRIHIIAKKHLTTLNLEDAKTCAYEFTQWASHLVTPENKTIYEEIECNLFKYKYKKQTQPLTSSEQKALQSFLESTHG